MTALSEAIDPRDILNAGTSSLRNSIVWGAIFRPVSSILLVQWGELSDEAREVLSKIKSFSQLRENWDSYGAAPPSKMSLQNALSFVKSVDKQRLPIFFTAPGPNGEVLVELKHNNRSIEVMFGPDGKASYSRFDGTECVEEGVITDQILPFLTDWLYS